jgi:hypothetical protein
MDGNFFGGIGRLGRRWVWGVLALGLALGLGVPASSRAVDPLKVGGLPVT